MPTRRVLAGALAMLVGAGGAAAQTAGKPIGPTVIDVALAGGHIQRLLYQAPAQPVAVAMLFPGGAGRIGIDGKGNIAFTLNFLVRSRAQWHAAGIATATLDAPSYTRDLFGRRLELEYARAIREVVLHLRKVTPAPIWLVGTSAGTVGAAHAASAIPAGEITGLVLTSPVTITGRNVRTQESVFGANLGRIAVPTVIAVHAEDGCAFTPPNQAMRLKSKLTGAPGVAILTMTGGQPAIDPNPCEALAAHGFLGIETQTVNAIAAQMIALTMPR